VLCILLEVMDNSRGSLAWLWRQTHNLESTSSIKRGPEVAGSNPAPGTKNQNTDLCLFLCFCCLDKISDDTQKKLFYVTKKRQNLRVLSFQIRRGLTFILRALEIKILGNQVHDKNTESNCCRGVHKPLDGGRRLAWSRL
jgi:hypothetical protein